MAWIPDKIGPAAEEGVGTKFKLRESGTECAVVLLVDDREVYRAAEYRGVTEYIQRRYNLTDEALLALSRDYKDSVEAEQYHF